MAEFDNGCASLSANKTSTEEEERDGNAEDQHRLDTTEDEEGDGGALVLEAQPPPRPRRKRKVAQWPEDKIVVTELTEDGMPIEKKAQLRMRKLAGLIARQRISLVKTSFSCLSELDKEQLFDECVQPRLEFPEALKARARKKMMQMVAKSWRTHKSDLVRCFVKKGMDARVKHPYILRQDWEAFVKLKDGEEAKATSDKYKKLRERNTHDHYLGTGGYAGIIEKWEREDRELAAEGIGNPWDQFPPSRTRNWLRARSRLVKSEGCAKIHWLRESAESVSKKILEKQADLESSELINLVKEQDMLTQVLGSPEQTRRVRGVSSYNGWRFWPDCTSMYRKRKRSDVDVEAIKEEVRSQVTKEVTQQVTKDIMNMLREQGLQLSLPSSATPTSAVGLNSSCASASDAVCNAQLDGLGGIPNLDSVDLLTEPTTCTLVLNPGGYQVEVARGRVFPKQTDLYSVLVHDGYAVVHVDYVYPEHEGFVLTLPPSDEITTLGEALSKRIQWRRCWIVVSPRVLSSPISARNVLPAQAAKSNPKNLVVANSSSSQDDQAKSSAGTIQKCASKQHAEDKKQTKSTRAPAGLPIANRAAKSDNKMDQQVGDKQQHEAQPTITSSKSAPVASVWAHANPKFNLGQPMLSATEVFFFLNSSATEVEKAGPGCVALHAHYMKACAENRNTGIVAMIKREHFWRESETEPFVVALEDLFDLFTLDGLDISLLRCLTLCLIVEARHNSVPVGLLDPDPLSIKSMNSDRGYSVGYLQRCLRKHANKKFVMFAHNCGGHWIAVIIVPSWHKVLYLDSNRGRKQTDLSGLKSVIDEAFRNTLPKNKLKKGKLIHATKIPCLQQGLDHTCGFYAAHNLMIAMRLTNLEDPEEFEVLTTPINLQDIREKIAMFIVSYIIDHKGEFHWQE